MHSIDSRTKQIENTCELGLDRSVQALDRNSNDLLIGYEKGELRLINACASSTRTGAEVSALDLPRVSAASLLNNRYLLIAQKGGKISQVDVLKASDKTLTTQSDAIARACKLLCEILRRCGCLKPCDCRTPTDPRDPNKPDRDPDDNPDGGPIDDEPCGERRSVNLRWTVKRLARVGSRILAFSADNKRMAVLDQKLNLIFERRLGRRNIAVNIGSSTTQRLVIINPLKQNLEAWSIEDYIAKLPGNFPDDLKIIPPVPASSITYYGNEYHRPAPNPTLNICIFTVVEPGQSFTDSNQNQMMSLIGPNVIDVVNDYYDEVSFGIVDTQLSVFGYDFGGTRTPLVLPQPMADYFYDEFTTGGLEAVMPADWADPIFLDGSESLALRTNPRVGSSRDYTVPFAALWTNQTHNSYPLTVDFDGTETLDLSVENQEGNSYVLSLNFNAFSRSLNQGDDEAAFLSDLGEFVTTTIRDAEATLAGNPVTIQVVTFRRIRINDDDTEFGRLQGQFQIAPPADPADASQKGSIMVTTLPPTPLPAALDIIGFTIGSNLRGELTSASRTRNYFTQCLSATQADMGEGPGGNDPHFDVTLQTADDAETQELTVQLLLVNDKGGQGANIEVTAHSELNTSGWNNTNPLPGGDSTSNNRNTMRYSEQLANDVFTAALDHIRASGPWNASATGAMFEDFDGMMVAFVGAPATPGAWGANDPADLARLRMFVRGNIATDQNNPNPAEPPVTMNTSLVIGQVFKGYLPGVMAHEIGHALDLPDLYSASGFRDDVLYINSWGMMAGGNENLNHFCGWSKWSLGWIPEDADDDINRVIDVPLPSGTGTSATEAWLVPIEYWDNSMKDDVRSEVGGSTQIVQLMKLDLGSDGGVINFIELHAPGNTYSQNLPSNPNASVIVTNVLDPANDRRWAVNGLYRRSVHRINQGDELRNVGDSWDFAAGVEFPLKGCSAEIMDIRTIRGGTIPVYRVRVEREAADYIDLFFEDNVPSYLSPDIWIDWPGDNDDPDVPRMYPDGTPTDQGETIRFPSSGTEKHYVVARVHNAGTVRAEDVKVRWFICDPPGSGDSGRWIQRETKIINEVGPGSNEIVAFDWNVDSSTNVHQCLRAEIIDWSIPSEVDPSTGDTLSLASDDVKLQNNNAQQNVFDFEARAGSPYDDITFQMQVFNDYVETETALLIPKNLPWGATLKVSPAEANIRPGSRQIFNCTLSMDENIIKPGCNNDSGFLLTAWRRAQDSDENWGSCFYFIRPRYKTGVEALKGYWVNDTMMVYGNWKLLTSEDVDISSEKPLFVRIRIAIHQENKADRVYWYIKSLDNNDDFELSIYQGIAITEGESFTAQVWFDRTGLLASSVSKAMSFNRQSLL